MAEHKVALHQGSHWPDLASPTARNHYTIGFLTPEPLRGDPPSLRVRPTEAISEVRHIELEAMRLHVVPDAEGVVNCIVVIGESKTLRFKLDHRCRLHVKIPKIAKNGKAWVIIGNQAGLVRQPLIKAHADAQRCA